MFKLLKAVKSGNLKEIEKGKLKPNVFDKESEMRDFFAKNDNLNKFFSSFYFLISERKVNSKSIADTIAFNPNDRTFAFFEYKLESETKLKQIINYKENLSNNDKKKLFDWAINEYYLKNGLRAVTDINKYQRGWESSPKLVIVNSQSRNKWEGLVAKNTSFVEVGVYNLEGNDYFYVETIDTELFRATREKKKVDEAETNEPTIPLPATKEEIILWLLEKNSSNKQVKKWFLEAVRYISKLKNPYLDEKYWYYSIVYKWKKKRVLVIKPQKRSLSISFEDNEITQSLKYMKSGWWSDDLKRKETVKKENEFLKTFELVKNYLKKVLV
ncbi:hypothetical protein [endosymbiont GvMRE of Glomus versiforme]|uniref:hypothetical protein n=1 Tax=endosymbiont GvMRE of Glomus versiforme TaxID=2039283 RepID=UPI000ED46BB2|nr:hypothetical protein [endosymbiont GvMRE of Glomus versiforme]RHZ37008.1 hypothetical protein GvMRE_I2g344 [endosymbiont GvMRE of Glomus versiforme]